VIVQPGTNETGCEDCLSIPLPDQVFPPASTSVDALGILPNPIGRDDEEFLKYAISVIH
jgi:hypothetical protein